MSLITDNEFYDILNFSYVTVKPTKEPPIENVRKADLFEPRPVVVKVKPRRKPLKILQ